MVKLLKLPTILKVGDKELEAKNAKKSASSNLRGADGTNYEDTNVKIYDQSITSPLNQFRQTNIDDALKLYDKRKEKNQMAAQIHEISKGKETV